MANPKLMNKEAKKSRVAEWEKFWNEISKANISDHEYDRGHGPRAQEIEQLANDEFFEFVAPNATEVVFDAGCGSGVNLFRLHSRVGRIIGMDYVEGAIQRCRERLATAAVRNVELFQGSITNIPLADSSVNKVLCMSVMQYLDDSQLRGALHEFARILSNNGVVILHVKNFSSIYLSTLRLAKRVKQIISGVAKLEYIRSFSWYERELATAGFEIIDYNSSNLFTIDLMPKKLVGFLQGFELRHRKKAFFRNGFIRRHGSDLKIRARLKIKI